MKNKSSVIILLLALLVPSFIVAQDSNLGNWLIYIGNKKLNTEWNLHHEVQYRNYNAIGDLEQLLLRTGVGKNLTEGNNNLLLGYGFIRSENFINEDDKICPGNKGSGEIEIKLSDLKKVGALGQGASGFVEKCFHTISKTRIALKQIPVESQEMVNKQLLLEAAMVEQGAFKRLGSKPVTSTKTSVETV